MTLKQKMKHFDFEIPIIHPTNSEFSSSHPQPHLYPVLPLIPFPGHTRDISRNYY